MRSLPLVLLLAAAGVWGQTSAPFHRGVNLTGWFQTEDARHLPFSRFGESDFDNLKTLGADGVRLPVNLIAFAGPGPAYRLDPRFLSLLDRALDGLSSRGLTTVLDNHSAWDAPRFQSDREGFLKAVWGQLAARYRARTGLVYEIQNEPHDVAAAEWDRLQRATLAAIRAHDSRLVVVTGADWGSVKGLLALTPYADKNLLYSFHFYDPFRFTHQGADWAGQADLAGIEFPSAEGRPDELARTLDAAAGFARDRGVTLFCGEFGVYNKAADPADRAVWYRTVRTLLEERRVTWTMWDYRDSFGLFRKGSAEVFEQDLDPALVSSLGFFLPPQRTASLRRPAAGFDLYRDGWALGTKESVWAPAGVVDFYSTDRPRGSASLLIADVDRYSSVGWDWAPWGDLTAVAERGRLVFWARTAASRFAVELRWVDGQTPDGLPWRLSWTLDQTRLPADGAWHRIEVPLKDMRETGAWDGAWHPPQPGSFAWNRVARFEIAAEFGGLKGELSFDDLAVEVSE